MKITASQKKDRPNLWEAKGIDPATGKRKSYYQPTKELAEAKALASYRLAPLPLNIDRDSLYGYYATVYLPTIAHRSDNWQNQVGWAMDNYVIPSLGDLKIKDISRSECQSLFNKLLGQMKTSSVRKIKIVLSCVLNLAEDDDAIAKNPVRRVRLPMDEAPDKLALTFEQLNLLLTHAQPRAVPIILLAGGCGLRIGEACAPSWAEVEGNTLKVRHQILQPKGGAIRTAKLKTPQSRRDIPMPKEMMDRLRNAGQVSGIYITSDSKGGYLTPNNATRELTEACERAGLGNYIERKGKKVFVPLVSPHELRHTFTSLMENELEAPPAIVACLLGRKYEGLNAGYSHTHEKQLAKWMEKYWVRMSTSVRQIDLSHTG